MRLPATALLLATLVPALPAGEFPSHHLLVGSQGQDRVLLFSPAGLAAGSFGASSGLAAPSGFALGPDGKLYVASFDTDRVVVLDGDGSHVATLGAGTDLEQPRGLAFGPDGRLYVGDGGAGLVRVLSPDGDELGTVGSGLVDPLDLAFGLDGHLFVACGEGSSVFEFDRAGALVREFESEDLAGAGGLALGSDGRLYVASPATNSVLVFDADGEQVDVLGEGVLDEPGGLAFDPLGRLAVLSRGTNEVVLLSLGDEVVSTLAADLEAPFGVAFVPKRLRLTLRGLFVVTDEKQRKVRQTGVLSVAPAGPIMFEFHEGPVADALNLQWLVLPALQTQGPPQHKRHAYAGTWSPEDMTASLLSTALSLQGKVNKKTGNHLPKNARGKVFIGDPGALLNAQLTGGKALN